MLTECSESRGESIKEEATLVGLIWVQLFTSLASRHAKPCSAGRIGRKRLVESSLLATVHRRHGNLAGTHYMVCKLATFGQMSN